VGNIKEQFENKGKEVGFLQAFFEMQYVLTADIFASFTSEQRKIVLRSAISSLALGFIAVVSKFGDAEEKALLRQKTGVEG